MKIHKSVFYCSLLISVFVTACESDNGDENPPAEKQLRLAKEIINETGYGTSTRLYFYDAQNRLRKIASDWTDEFFYNDNGTLDRVVYAGNSSTQTEKYFYKNGKIDFIERVGFNKNTNIDTLFFFYGSDGKPERTKSSYYSEGIVSETTVDYVFDDNNRLLSRFEKNKYDNILSGYDSTFYTWSTTGNLYRIDTRMWAEGLVNYTNKIEYEYDNKLNFYKTANYPAQYLLYRSMHPDERFSVNNNLVELRTSLDGSSYSYIHNIGSYNEQGYPLMITANWGTWELEYEEY